MRNLYCLLPLIIMLTSCTPRIMENGRYETSLEANVVHMVPKDLNSYDMLIVPAYETEVGKDLGYFPHVMTHNQVDELLDLEPNDSVNPRQLSEVLKEEGISNKYLVLEYVMKSGLRDVFQLNLADPLNDEVLFSAWAQLNQHRFKEVFGALGNSLIDYLAANSKKLDADPQEVLVKRPFPAFTAGFNPLFSVLNPSSKEKAKFAMGLEVFGEYRVARPLAIELGLSYSLVAPFSSIKNRTMIAGAPIFIKWYTSNSFDIHLGPQLNYYNEPEYFAGKETGLINENKLVWDVLFGIGYNWENILVVNLDYSKGMSELGKEPYLVGESGPSLKLETFSLGLGIKF